MTIGKRIIRVYQSMSFSYWLLLGILITFALILFVYDNPSTLRQTNTTENVTENISKSEPSAGSSNYTIYWPADYGFIIQTAEAVAGNHTYSNNYAHQYNCWDFSTDLKHDLINAGYDASIAAGLYDPTCTGNFTALHPHAWVIVKYGNLTIPVETTPGNIVIGIISDEDYKDCYKFGYIQTDKINSYKDEFLVRS